MSLTRCVLCNLVAPLVDRLCWKCIDVVEAYLDAQADDMVDEPDCDPDLLVPGVPDSQDSDVSVDLSDDDDLDDDIIDHVPDASAK